jgi:hypothetical protein
MSVTVAPQEWRAMAGRLCQCLRQINDNLLRLQVLNALVKKLGVDAYPALIKLLLIVSESSDQQTRARLAETLGFAARRSDLPKGALNAWGLGSYMGTAMEAGLPPVDAASLMRRYQAGSATRGLGPIEYLTVWHCQKTQRPYLSDHLYQSSLIKIIDLMDADSMAARHYAEAILQDLETQVEGAFTRQTRLRLRSLANAWLEGGKPEAVARAAMAFGQT